jgi:hypothetical protein
MMLCIRNLSTFTVLALSSALVQSTTFLLTEERLVAFSEWVETHEKEYDSVEDYNRRLMTWAENDGESLL